MLTSNEAVISQFYLWVPLTFYKEFGDWRFQVGNRINFVIVDGKRKKEKKDVDTGIFQEDLGNELVTL